MPTQTAKRRSFETTALPHLSGMYGAAFRLTRNPSDAEDLLQDTMLRAYRFWDSYKQGSNCRAWLYKILTNTFLNGYQRKKRGREVLQSAAAEQSVLDGVLVQERSQEQATPEEQLLSATLSEPVERALSLMPADFRVAVVLCDIEEFSYKEIADIMECPVGTVMSRLYRGRRILKKELKSFAASRGVIKGEQKDSAEGSEPSMIHLDDYRTKNV